jgi:hypothetical protein
MADSHPFSNAGLGMFGTAERQYAQKGMQGGQGGGNLLGGSIAALLQSFGVGQKGGAQPSQQGIEPPLPASQSYKPIAPNYGMGTLPSTGVNPSGMSQYVAPNFAQPQQASPTQQNDDNYISSFKLPRL